jgi:hypothetical protein
VAPLEHKFLLIYVEQLDNQAILLERVAIVLLNDDKRQIEGKKKLSEEMTEVSGKFASSVSSFVDTPQTDRTFSQNSQLIEPTTVNGSP